MTKGYRKGESPSKNPIQEAEPNMKALRMRLMAVPGVSNAEVLMHDGRLRVVIYPELFGRDHLAVAEALSDAVPIGVDFEGDVEVIVDEGRRLVRFSYGAGGARMGAW